MSSEPLTVTDNNPQVKKEVKFLKTLSEMATGTVKWYNLRNLYGFIRCTEDGKDIFVHKSAIANYHKFPSLRIGEKVEFKIVQTTNGIEAANVTGPDGGKVRGFRFMNTNRRVANNGEARNGESEDQQGNKVNTKNRNKNSFSGSKSFPDDDYDGDNDMKKRINNRGGKKPNGQVNGGGRYNVNSNGDESNGPSRGGRAGRGGRGGRGPMRGGRGRGGAANAEQA